jgi:NAD(P)-dependent dehydrogenase (short-subunit alcohol dehydrogenase family)
LIVSDSVFDKVGDLLDAAAGEAQGRSEAVAAAVLCRCSDEASFVLGVALPVDGGYTASSSISRWSRR